MSKKLLSIIILTSKPKSLLICTWDYVFIKYNLTSPVHRRRLICKAVVISSLFAHSSSKMHHIWLTFCYTTGLELWMAVVNRAEIASAEPHSSLWLSNPLGIKDYQEEEGKVWGVEKSQKGWRSCQKWVKETSLYLKLWGRFLCHQTAWGQQLSQLHLQLNLALTYANMHIIVIDRYRYRYHLPPITTHTIFTGMHFIL